MGVGGFAEQGDGSQICPLFVSKKNKKKLFCKTKITGGLIFLNLCVNDITPPENHPYWKIVLLWPYLMSRLGPEVCTFWQCYFIWTTKKVQTRS